MGEKQRILRTRHHLRARAAPCGEGRERGRPLTADVLDSGHRARVWWGHGRVGPSLKGEWS